MDKLLINVSLRTLTQLHIGSGKDAVSDAMLYRRGDGALVVPGSSIAGALRARATYLWPALLQDKQCDALTGKISNERICSCIVCRVFGDISPQARHLGHISSRIIIHDSLPLANNTAVRDGVGIQRKTRAAADAVKYDYEVVSSGTPVTFQIEASFDTKDTKEEQLLASLLAEIGEGRITFGGKSSRGLGRLDLESITAKRLPTFSREKAADIAALLKSDNWFDSDGFSKDWFATRLNEGREQFQPTPTPYLQFESELAFKEAFLTRDSFRAVAGQRDAIPLLQERNGKLETFISGSSIRGTLRSQSERIARTIAAAHDIDPWAAACEPFEQGEDNCLACRLFGNTAQGSRLKVADAEVLQEGKLFVQDYLAVDRFTGGGSDGRKFDAVLAWQPSYKLQLSIDSPEPWEVGWLALTLRDIADGLTTFGSGAAKGLGVAELKDAKVRFIGWAGLNHGEEHWSGVLPARTMSFDDFLQTELATIGLKALHDEVKALAEGGTNQ